MINAMILVFFAIFIWLSAYWQAHDEVSIECQKLGAFYVGDKVFECKEKK